MCGQYDPLLGLVYELLVEPRPTQRVRPVVPTVAAPVVVRDDETGQTGVMEARFGLVPHWYKGALRDWKAATFNARVEEAATKPTFKGPFKYRHCIVPAERFYEWSGAAKARRKFDITRIDNQPMAFAGLWDEARLAEGDVFSFAILTRAAGPDMAVIHDREPCILGPDSWDDWLACRSVDLAAYTPLKVSDLTPAPTQDSLF